VGKVSKATKKGNWVRGREKIKFQKTNLRSGLRKGKEKKSTWDGIGIENRILSVHHPSMLVHCWFSMAPSYARIRSRHYEILISKI